MKESGVNIFISSGLIKVMFEREKKKKLKWWGERKLSEGFKR